MKRSSFQVGERLDFFSKPTKYGNCSCALSDACQQQVEMYSNGNRSTYDVRFSIPNFFIGCFVIQSVLQSSLECFFNQTCLDAVQTEILSVRSINISILHANATRFLPETLIGTLADTLMVEQWGRTIQYDQYYAQCAPILCSYKRNSRGHALYVFTTLIGLIGGLAVALQVFVPFVVRWIRNHLRPKVELNDTTTGKFYG